MQPTHYPETVPEMHEHLRNRLHDVAPDFELQLKAEVAVEVNRLKKERNAVILGHNYMEPALFHSVADYTGDSLGLCRIAAQSSADIIVFCGVRFMAETAKILNPERKVLLPSLKAGCSLAESITADDVRALKELYPGAPVVAYVNTYADVKAEVDYCCTSGNATEMVRHLLSKYERIVFLPDEYLSENTAREVGIPIVFAGRERGVLVGPRPDALPSPVMIGWRGRCEVHEQFTVADVTSARKQFPDVTVLAHPECSPEVVAAADYSGSTTQMTRYVENLQRGRILLLTECSMGDNIAQKRPTTELLRMCSIRCPHMNQITLEQTLESLRHDRYLIDVQPETRQRAHKSLDRMLEIG